jgi:hypothetical protein
MIQPLDPAECERRLLSLSSLIAQSLSRANVRARDFFASQKLPFEAFTFTTLHRYFTRLYLADADYVVADECEIPIEPKRLPNIGLQVIYDALSCRILKATATSALPPPRTDARVAYYCQQLALNLSSDGEAAYTEGNVTYLWEDDDDSHELRHVWMVWPKSAVRGDVSEAWRIEIQLPPQAGREPGQGATPLAPLPPRTDLPIGIPTEDVQSGRVD